MGQEHPLRESFVQLARLAVTGRQEDAAVYVQRAARKLRDVDPEIASELVGLLRDAPTRSSPLRRAGGPAAATPVDGDTRLDLVVVEPVPQVEIEPILPPEVARNVDQLVEERRRRDDLLEAGLFPTRTALFTGPPGVGKTLVARTIASRLGLPLMILDLTAVMSSLLGKTGVNLRQVLDHARAHPCVLLIDEIDSIGKRRGDDSDIGELKRLVNVLLQQLDSWPADASLLVGATNHPELLDPAIWRRFEQVIQFPLPDDDARREAVTRFLHREVEDAMAGVLARAFVGCSFSDVQIALMRAHRASALGHGTLDECLAQLVSDRVCTMDSKERIGVAVSLVDQVGLSQRRANQLTGVSRDTIRKHSEN